MPPNKIWDIIKSNCPCVCLSIRLSICSNLVLIWGHLSRLVTQFLLKISWKMKHLLRGSKCFFLHVFKIIQNSNFGIPKFLNRYMYRKLCIDYNVTSGYGQRSKRIKGFKFQKVVSAWANTRGSILNSTILTDG